MFCGIFAAGHSHGSLFVGTVAALKWLLHILGGAIASSRRLYMGLQRSMAQYGVPVRVEALIKRNVAFLRRAQRVMAFGIKDPGTYHTTIFEAAYLLAGSPTWDLEAGIYARGHVPVAH